MSELKKYAVELEGTAEMFFHWDDVEWGDEIAKARLQAKKDKTSVAGDDRSPAFTWMGYCYRDDAGLIAIPFMNLSAALLKAGSQIGTGKKQQTFKSATQSGMRFVEAFWPLTVKGRQISFSSFSDKLMAEKDFSVHKKVAQKNGFTLDVRRATVGATKHVRVRPLFPPRWKASGHVLVSDERITIDVVRELFDYAGRYVGIGDWRPGAPKKPGPYGTFNATVSEAR